MGQEDPSAEIASLRTECERLRKERDNYYADLKTREEQAEQKISANLTLLSKDLAKQVQEDFFGRVKTILWLVGIFAAIATLGGFFTFRELAQHAIDQAIEKREADFKRLADTAIEDVVRVRTETARALDETRRLTDVTRADLSKKSAEIGKETENARRLILDTTKYWDAAKIAANRATGSQPKPDNQAEEGRTVRILNCLKSAGVHDADVDLFDAVTRNDLAAVKSAMDRGGNPIVTIGELIRRHHDIMARSCPAMLR